MNSTHTHTRTHAHTHHTHMHARTHTHHTLHTHAHVHTHHTCTHMHARTHAHTHACTHTHARAHTQSVAPMLLDKASCTGIVTHPSPQSGLDSTTHPHTPIHTCSHNLPLDQHTLASTHIDVVEAHAMALNQMGTLLSNH